MRLATLPLLAPTAVFASAAGGCGGEVHRPSCGGTLREECSAGCPTHLAMAVEEARRSCEWSDAVIVFREGPRRAIGRYEMPFLYYHFEGDELVGIESRPDALGEGYAHCENHFVSGRTVVGVLYSCEEGANCPPFRGCTPCPIPPVGVPDGVTDVPFCTPEDLGKE
jgi:hypothetical protein